MTKKKIVIIDKDVSFIENLKRDILLSPDMEITAATNSAVEGMGMIKNINPDIIVVDCPIQDADVVMFLSAIPKTPNQIRILSCQPGFEGIKQLVMQNRIADMVIGKPYNSNVIADIIAQLEIRNEANLHTQNAGIYMKNNGLNGVEQQPPMMPPYQSGPQYGQPNPYGAGYMPGGQIPPQSQPGYQPPYSQGQNFPNPGAAYPGMNQGPQQFQNPYMAPNFNQQQPYQAPMNQNPTPNLMQGSGFRTLKQTIIAIGCPKGGVGKTTVAKEIAVALSAVKIGGQPLKVLLVDSDIEFGDTAGMLKLSPLPNVSQWASDIRTFRATHPNEIPRYSEVEILSKYLLEYKPTGLKVLAAPSSHADSMQIGEAECKIIYDNLIACNFDVVIFDTGNNTHAWTMYAYEAAHYIPIVTTLDVATIEDTYKLFNTLRAISFPMNKVRLIVNRVPRGQKDIEVNEIVQVLKVGEPIGQIPDCDNVRVNNNNGTPLVLGRESEFTVAIKRIANAMVPVFNGNRAMGGPNRQKQPQKSGGFFGFFKK